jgi:hypothetical protein
VIQRGNKPEEKGMPSRVMTVRWPWTNYSQSVELDRPISEIKSVEIDPSLRMADVNRENNKVEVTTLPEKK